MSDLLNNDTYFLYFPQENRRIEYSVNLCLMFVFLIGFLSYISVISCVKFKNREYRVLKDEDIIETVSI